VSLEKCYIHWLPVLISFKYRILQLIVTTSVNLFFPEKVNPILILLGLLDAEDEGTKILQNVKNDLSSGTASHSRRTELSE